MSKKEKKTGLSRAEIAAELRALADDLEKGRLRVGAQHVRINEPFFFKIKQKLDGEVASFTMLVEMALALGSSPFAGQPLFSGAKPGIPEPSQKGELGYRGRKLKKEIGRLWESVARLIEAETMPDATETERLRLRCEEYNLFADAAWQADWVTCTRLIQQCLTDAATGDWPAAKNMVAAINRMLKDCHHRFKN